MTPDITIAGTGAGEIAASAEAAIREGRLGSGERLPTIRELADRLGVSPTTVSSAYRTLRLRGLVSTHSRAGTRVALPTRSRGRLFTPIPPGTRNLADGNPDPELLPPLGPSLAMIDSDHVLYGDQPNHPRLLRAAATAFSADGIPTDGIGVVGGARDAIERILAAHLPPGDRVAVEDPGFAGIFELLDAFGLATVAVAVDEAGMLPDSLEQALGTGVRAVLVVPRAQNPTGAAMDEARTIELRNVLDARPRTLLVEDDHAGPVAGAPARTLWSESRECWAVIRSVSKSLGPDLRLALVAADPDTIARVEDRQLVGPGWVSHLLQRLVAHLLEDPEVDRLTDRAASTYAARRNSLLAALEDLGIAAQGRSGTNVWIPVPDEVSVTRGLAEAGWAVAPGEHFRIASPSGIRVTTAGLDENDAVHLGADLARIMGRRRRAPLA